MFRRAFSWLGELIINCFEWLWGLLAGTVSAVTGWVHLQIVMPIVNFFLGIPDYLFQRLRDLFRVLISFLFDVLGLLMPGVSGSELRDMFLPVADLFNAINYVFPVYAVLAQWFVIMVTVFTIRATKIGVRAIPFINW
jgi:hypothetical protein